jgi:DNA repair protein RadC
MNMSMSTNQFYVRTGARYRAATPSEICEGASTYLFAKAAQERPKLASPAAAREFLRAQAGLDHEQFGIVYLDTRHRVLSVQILFEGTIDGANVWPREVCKRTLIEGAAAVMVFHNHPSGDPSASHADEMITQRLKQSLALIDVRLIDHLIVSHRGITSLAERGLI